MKVVFRITLEYVRENEDVILFLNQLGTDLFLVLHEKPNNYHYHGLLDIKQTAKTFRKKIGELLDPRVEPPKGFRPITVSDKVDDENGYKSYCLFRPGHSVKHIYVNNENINLLKEIADKKIKPVASNKSDKDLAELKGRVSSSMNTLDIANIVVGYYNELGKKPHIAHMQQLIWGLRTHLTGTESLARQLVLRDEGLELAYQQEIKPPTPPSSPPRFRVKFPDFKCMESDRILDGCNERSE